MAKRVVELGQDTYSCSICLEVLKDPVTIPCGDSYCMDCIKDHWDEEDQTKRYSCPQCRKMFTSRPRLVKNTKLVALVEELKKSGIQRERQRELEGSQHNIQQRIQDRQKDLKLLQQKVEDISRSADKTVEDSDTIITELNHLRKKRQQQEAEVSRVKELKEEVEQEIRELKRKDAELKKLSDTEDHSQFLQDYPSLSGLSGSTHSSSINIRPLRHFEDVTAAVSQVRDQPKTRAEFFKYSREIILDPDTVNRCLILSEGNRKVTRTSEEQSYLDHPDRFTDQCQVLSRESLTGRCYWELKWSGRIDVAVTYKNISRTGLESLLGNNDKSWTLICGTNSLIFYHNSEEKRVSGPKFSRLGVYLDHRAGLLSFYSISGTMTLLHRVRNTFTQPLHVGLYIHDDSTVELCEVKQTFQGQ